MSHIDPSQDRSHRCLTSTPLRQESQMATMSPLRQRMIEDMTIRNLSPEILHLRDREVQSAFRLLAGSVELGAGPRLPATSYQAEALLVAHQPSRLCAAVLLSSHPGANGGMRTYCRGQMPRDNALALAAKLPGSRMIPAAHALRAALALKLWSIERKSHVMALVADEGLALFCGLNASAKKSFLSEYSSRITRQTVSRLLASWHTRFAGDALFTGESLNLDFHSVPYFGEHPLVQSHYLAKRSRRQPASSPSWLRMPTAMCSATNADIRKGEEADEVFRFIDFWTRIRPRPAASRFRFQAHHLRGARPARRRRDHLHDPAPPAPRAYSPTSMECPTGLAHRHTRPATPQDSYAADLTKIRSVCASARPSPAILSSYLGHDEPTILITNDASSPLGIPLPATPSACSSSNALADAVRFFHIDVLSSGSGSKSISTWPSSSSPFASTALTARRMRGDDYAQARQLFVIVDMPADVAVTPAEVRVRFHRRAHLPIVLASGLIDKPVTVPCGKAYPCASSNSPQPVPQPIWSVEIQASSFHGGPCLRWRARHRSIQFLQVLDLEHALLQRRYDARRLGRGRRR